MNEKTQKTKNELKTLQRRLFSLVLGKMSHRSRARVRGCLEAICDTKAYSDKAHRAKKIRSQEKMCARKHDKFADKVADRTLSLKFLDDCYYHDGLMMGYHLIDKAIDRSVNKQK